MGFSMSSSFFINRLAELQEGALYGRPALLRAYQKLCRLSNGAGYIPLSGGVRGWSAALSVGLGYVKSALRQLDEAGIVAVDFLGDGLAEVYLVRPLPADVSVPARETVTAVTAVVSHERSIDDRSPLTPYKVLDHDLIQQQQQVAEEQDFDLPEETVNTLLAMDADREVIHKIALLRPRLTAAKVRDLYDNALSRPEVEYPNGLVFDVLMQPGEPRIRRGRAPAPPGAAAPPPAPSGRSRGRRAPAAEALDSDLIAAYVAENPDLFRLGSDVSDLDESDLDAPRDWLPPAPVFKPGTEPPQYRSGGSAVRR
jgi:hypothetical protein